MEVDNMPLTVCPDCNRKISTRSEHCIHCGCPSLFYRDGELCAPDDERTVNRPGNEESLPKILTIRQAAASSGIPEHAIRGMVKRHEIPIMQSGTRVYINLNKLREHIWGIN